MPEINFAPSKETKPPPTPPAAPDPGIFATSGKSCLINIDLIFLCQASLLLFDSHKQKLRHFFQIEDYQHHK